MTSHTKNDNKKLDLKRHKVYKRVKMLVEHCNVCGEQLLGNGSNLTPWRCSCGEWESQFSFSGALNNEYQIKVKAL